MKGFTNYDIFKGNGDRVYQAILNDNDPNLVHEEWLTKKMDELAIEKNIDRSNMYWDYA